MNKRLILWTILLTLFLDFFNLGLIYPIFSSLIFEGAGGVLSAGASEFYKNAIFGILIAVFPFGQFLGAPIIGRLSDHFGRRKLLILSLIGTIVGLLLCVLGIYCSAIVLLLLGRLFGGLMAGNVTLAFASLADLSTGEDKVRNFALIPITGSAGFALGPFLAGILANPETTPWSGPVLPFLVAACFSMGNLLLVVKKFPNILSVQNEKKSIKDAVYSGFKGVSKIFFPSPHRPFLWILFLMISANFVFFQFLGPFAAERFKVNITEMGYLYTNVGMGAALGNLILTRWLAKYVSSEKALSSSLVILSLLLVALVFSYDLITLHVLTFLVMLACAVGYTNAMALVSNQGSQEVQGETMGLAASIQSFSEFMPAFLIGFVSFKSENIPMFAAAIFAVSSYLILKRVRKIPQKAVEA